MRNIVIGGILNLLLITTGCQSTVQPLLLVKADSLSHIQPDSAFRLLISYRSELSTADKDTRMYYYLLQLRTADKMDLQGNRDSIAFRVARYYEKHNSKKHLSEAYFHMGKMYNKHGDAPQGLKNFLKALENSHPGEDWFIGELYTQIGQIYFYQDMYEKALSVFQEAYRYSTTYNDNLTKAYTLYNIGCIYDAMGKGDSTLHYYTKAHQQAVALNNKKLKREVGRGLAKFYYDKKDYPKALSLLRTSTPLYISDINPYYMTLARYYEEICKPDSAEIYYKILCNMGNYQEKRDAYSALTNIAKQQGDIEKSFHYMKRFKAYNDSTNLFNDMETIRKIEAFYNYQLWEKKSLQLEQVAQRQRTVLWVTLVVVLMCGTFFLYVYKVKREEARQTAKELKRISEEQYLQSEEYISENERALASIRKEVEDRKQEKHNMLLQLQLQQKQVLELKIELARNKRALDKLSTDDLAELQIYKDFYHVAGLAGFENASTKEHLINADWFELYNALNSYNDNFIDRLKRLCGTVSEQELRVSVLLRIGMRPTDIALLTARSKQAINSTCVKLAQCIIKEDAKAKDWETFIREF